MREVFLSAPMHALPGTGGPYYDPSYGLVAGSAQAYTGVAIDAWQKYDAGLDEYVWRQAQGDTSEVRFSTP